MNESLTEHPDETRLAGYLDGDLDASERGDVEAHLERCGECRRSVADAARVLADSPAMPVRSTDDLVARRAGASRRWLVVSGVLAASLAAVVVARTWRPLQSESIGVERSRALPIDEGLPTLPVYAPLNGVRLTTPPRTFQWASAGPVDHYRFVLLTGDAAQLWSTKTTDTTVALPPDVARQLTSGSTYLWRVDAFRNGMEATTRSRSFTIEP